MTTLQPQEVRTVEAGKHTGRVTDVKERQNPYEYIDFKVTLKDSGFEDVELTLSAPKSLSVKEGKAQSKLAQICVALGMDITKQVDVLDAIGTDIEFVTYDKKVGDNTFAEIIPDSLKQATKE